VLDPSIHTLPYLYTLLASIEDAKKGSSQQQQSIIQLKTADFVQHFDPVQVRYAGTEWRRLVESIFIGTDQGGHVRIKLDLVRAWLIFFQPNDASALIQTAMTRLDPETSTFTAFHLHLARLCLHRRQHVDLSIVYRILDNDIYHFPVDTDHTKHIPLPCQNHLTSSTFITTTSGFTSKVEYQDFLEYLLLGAMLYMLRQRWTRAILLLEIALAVPVQGNHASMIQVAAYKKWVLISLLQHGRVSRSRSLQLSNVDTVL